MGLMAWEGLYVCLLLCVRSVEFVDFIAKCLVKDPDLRSTASDLMQVNSCSGFHSPGKPGKVREFESGQGKVSENVFLHA